MPVFLTRRKANLAGFLACCGLMGYALYAQYVLLLEPCPLCSLQRVAVIAMGAVFLLAALHNPQSSGARVYAGLIVLVAAAGIAVAARHIWVQAQPPGSIAACGASLGYLMEIMSVFDAIKKVLAGSGECQQIDKLWGLSWPWWTVISMLVLGGWGLLANLSCKNR